MCIGIWQFKRITLTFIFCSIAFLAISQDKSSNSFLYPEVQESRLYETKWEYTYTLHQKSQVQVHHSTEVYKNYIYFKLDKTAQIYLNGIFSQQSWSIKGAKLHMPFKGLDSTLIIKLDGNILVLEYNNLTENGIYEYHFKKLDDNSTVFKKPDYLLPEVKIKSKRPSITSANESKGIFTRFWEWLFGSSKDDEPYKAEPTYINIEIIGGGFYGGIDPPIKNYIQLKTDGRLIREFETAYKGMVKTQKEISREELEQFVEYIDKKGFFELPSNIECQDSKCIHRLSKKPMPIPLRISVTYGIKHKVINVPIFGLDENNYNYLSYPPIIDQINDILNRMANRIDN